MYKPEIKKIECKKTVQKQNDFFCIIKGKKKRATRGEQKV